MKFTAALYTLALALPLLAEARALSPDALEARAGNNGRQRKAGAQGKGNAAKGAGAGAAAAAAAAASAKAAAAAKAGAVRYSTFSCNWV